MNRSSDHRNSYPLADYFADQLLLFGDLEPGIDTDRVLAAFRDVPREAFAGPGPWKLRIPLTDLRQPPVSTQNDDPRWLYHDVLVVLDEARGINIGQPSFWARLLARAQIACGMRILQIGAGVGYYTAILHQLTGTEGRVLAYETDAGLAERAALNLAGRDGVSVRHGNAATDLAGELTREGPFDLVIAFAGVTHVPASWSERLSTSGQLLVPLTGTRGWGAMILAKVDKGGFVAQTLGRCGFYHCIGARSEALAGQVDDLFSVPERRSGWRFRIDGVGEKASFIDYEA